MNVSKIVLFSVGALGGALVAGVAMLLLAPDSGEAIRHQAHEQFDTMLDEAQAAAEARRADMEAQLAYMTRSQQ